jgi:hypothetical protein
MNVPNPGNSECYIPSSEPFWFYFFKCYVCYLQPGKCHEFIFTYAYAVKQNRVDNIVMKDGSNLMMNSQSIAGKFNAHFIDIIDELKFRTKLYNVERSSWNLNPNSFWLVPITEYELVNTIRKLENSYLMGYDEFPHIIKKIVGST